MKKITFGIMAASMLLLFSPTQLKAGTESNMGSTSVETTVKSEATNISEVRLNEIKPIELSSLSTSKEKEMLKETSPLQNEQGRHNGRYRNQQPRRDVDVTIQADRGYHNHGGAYIGGGGVLLLILILILVL